MKQQMAEARAGNITAQMKQVAQAEGLEPEVLAASLADGQVVITANPSHKGVHPLGIGKGLRTKVNANLGTSSDFSDVTTELTKLRVALEAGADTIMDLSTGGPLREIRQTITSSSHAPLGTVPIYQASVQAIEARGSIVDMTADDLFSVIEEHARDGVDFMTVHCGVTLRALDRLRRAGRTTDVVSRGGSFLLGWMLHNEQENPLYEQFDRLLDLARRYDFTLSLGDGLRPGCLADASDRAQMEELLTLGELVDRSRAADVQAMVEGPGHLPLNHIEANVQMQKWACKGAPFYVLGPLVTDVGAGYDHITAAIGGAIAASAGADFLCYVTPAEHLSLPDAEDVRQGVIASRIAAHAADIVKGVKGAREWDDKMARARKALDWKTQVSLSIDPSHAGQAHGQHGTTGSGCSMCGKYCAMDLVNKYLGGPGRRTENC